jgi:hypothetical protein
MVTAKSHHSPPPVVVPPSMMKGSLTMHVYDAMRVVILAIIVVATGSSLSSDPSSMSARSNDQVKILTDS